MKLDEFENGMKEFLERDPIKHEREYTEYVLKLIAVVRAAQYVSENFYQFGTSDSNFTVWQSDLAEALAALELEEK